METGDVVFVRGSTWISRIIRFFDKGEFTHVALAISNDRIIEAQYNIRSRVKKLSYKSYEVVPMNLTEVQKKKLVSIISKYEGKSYDFPLAFSMVTGWLRIDNPNYLICTELDIDMLKEAGVLDPYLADMKPNEFYTYLTEVRKK
jgi:hypothetical protein